MFFIQKYLCFFIQIYLGFFIQKYPQFSPKLFASTACMLATFSKSVQWASCVEFYQKSIWHQYTSDESVLLSLSYNGTYKYSMVFSVLNLFVIVYYGSIWFVKFISGSSPVYLPPHPVSKVVVQYGPLCLTVLLSKP